MKIDHSVAALRFRVRELEAIIAEFTPAARHTITCNAPNGSMWGPGCSCPKLEDKTGGKREG